MPNREKKRASPSTMERNARRRKQFLAKKTTSASEENQADLEANQQALVEKRAFKCDQCETLFKTNNGLKIHIGKSHKAPNSPEKLRETSSEVLLSVSPSRKDRRAEPCPNCGGICLPHTSARMTQQLNMWTMTTRRRMNRKKLSASAQVQTLPAALVTMLRGACAELEFLPAGAHATCCFGKNPNLFL